MEQISLFNTDKKSENIPKPDNLADKKKLALELLSKMEKEIEVVEELLKRRYGSKVHEIREST